MTVPDACRIERVTDYSTVAAVAARFRRHRSAQLLLAGTAVVIALRIGLGSTGSVGWSVADAVAAGISLAAVGPVEWFAHNVLFHAPAVSRRSRLLGAGASHRRHHRDPTDLDWVVLDPKGARALMIAVAVLVTAWSVPAGLVAGPSPIGPYLTAVAIGWAAIANYEWTHLLVHSGYRPRSRFYRRLARNHRLHHYRNERYWLGVTTNVGDRLFGTLPGHDDAVPLSETARTLQ
ncbi:MAG: sterol desaturase family protein [Acidimicrobiia bacterium]|nr:sterol desaturase family protein [Acidimicrobiia bacterium]